MPKHGDTTLSAGFNALTQAVQAACMQYYGERLVSLAVYGSVARGNMRSDSDIDLLIVASPLPQGRMRRVEDFKSVAEALAGEITEKRSVGIHTCLSPIFKTPEEIAAGSPLLLDMIHDARILHDRDGFLLRQLTDLHSRLRKLGARRIVRGDVWWWDLKPSYRPGDTVVI